MGLTVTRNMERRRADRRPADAGVTTLTLALRTGTTVNIIDLSADGALVESSVRLEPGTKLAIRAFSAWEGVVHRAAVIHSRVWSLDRRSGIRFRAGLQFETGSGYTSNLAQRACGNPVPNHSGYQLGMWAARTKVGREGRAGTQVG